MNEFLTAAAVGAAGALGALGRFGLDSYFAHRQAHSPGGRHRPWATFIVNALGSALIGLAFGWYSESNASPAEYDIVAAGLAGGLTTFSSWTVATVKLWLEGRRLAAAGNLLANVVVGWGFASLGIWVASAVI